MEKISADSTTAIAWGFAFAKDVSCSSRLDLDHGWMNHRVELVDAWVLRIEGERGKFSAIQRAIGGDDLAAKGRDNLRIRALAWLHQSAPHTHPDESTMAPRSANMRATVDFPAAQISCKSYT